MTNMRCPPTTKRLRFRPYEITDLEAVVAMFDDEEARRWYPTQSQPEEAEGWIRWNQKSYEQHGFGLWAVEDLATETFVGDCGLTYQSVEGSELLEIGYHLQLPHRGNGYALESARGCASFALEVMKEPTVCSIVDPRNRASIQVAKSIHESFRTFVDDDGAERHLYWTDAK